MTGNRVWVFEAVSQVIIKKVSSPAGTSQENTELCTNMCIRQTDLRQRASGPCSMYVLSSAAPHI